MSVNIQSLSTVTDTYQVPATAPTPENAEFTGTVEETAHKLALDGYNTEANPEKATLTSNAGVSFKSKSGGGGSGKTAFVAAEDNARVSNAVKAGDTQKNAPIPEKVKAAAKTLSAPATPNTPGGGALFAGGANANKGNLEKISRGETIVPGYPPSKDEITAANILLDDYKATGGKGKGSALDQILQDGTNGDKFTLAGMQKSIADFK